MKVKKPVQEAPESQEAKETRPDPRLQALTEEVHVLKDKYLRAHAELENFKKRAAKERHEFFKYANEGLLRELLDVKDHLERSLGHVEQSSSENFQQGMELILKELLRLVEKFGVQEISTTGQTFNPKLHEALCHEVKEGVAPGTIVQEFKKGYVYHDRLLRPASVSIAAEGPPKA